MAAIPVTATTENQPNRSVELAVTERGNRSSRATWITLIAFLIVFELGARVLSAGLPDPEWNFAQTDRKVAQMEALRNGEGAEIVFVGNSAVNSDIISDVIARDSSFDSVYNAGLDGSPGKLTQDWATTVVEPLLSPDVVVIGLTSRDLNDGSRSNLSVTDGYLNSPGRAAFLGEESNGQKADRLFSDLFAIVKIRAFLRDPVSLITQYRDDIAEERLRVMDDFTRQEYFNDQILIDRTRERALNDYDTGISEGSQAAAVISTIETLQSRGVQVVVVEMPYSGDDYIDLHTNGQSDYDAYRATLQEIALTTDVPLIDGTQPDWSTDYFEDFLHLNSAAANEFSTNLAIELDALLAR
jgi:hypothetical protein